MNSSTATFRYHGTGGSLFGLAVVNGLLTIVTLGIYSFWAKNKVREFHYSHTEMDGDRFAYHGTGGELFSGALKASGIMIVLGLVFSILTALLGGPSASPMVTVAIGATFYVGIALLICFAINNARRYRLSRSSWRGIRFSFHGDSAEFLKMMVKGALLSIVTLGFYTPYFQNQRRAFLVNNARFGTEPFMYKADGSELMGEYIKAVLLTIPTLGLYWLWYAAFKHRYFWGNTTMRGGRFRSSVTGGELLKLHFINALLVFFTFGIGMAWAITRTQSFWNDNMALHGTVDWASIQQRAQEAAATGEGLAESFDVDVSIGM
jgi:uncharacterized membrane protein YjgN (DUF898 family)